MELFTNQVLAGIATGAIYACMALAVVMIYQAIDHLNFAQGEMAMFSTFLSWQMMQWGVPYWGAFILTLALSFAGTMAALGHTVAPDEIVKNSFANFAFEHYEIAAYGTDVALAEALGEKEVASLLSQTLEEEKQTDLKLTEVTQQHIMAEALGDEPEPAAGGSGSATKGRTKAA